MAQGKALLGRHARRSPGGNMTSFGSSNGQAKMSPEKAAIAKEMYLRGDSFTKIGKSLGVFRTTVAKVINGTHWAEFSGGPTTRNEPDPIFSNYTPVPESGCWIWLGGWDRRGYGKTGGNARSIKAHRLFFERFNGPIETGLIICHKCDTPACVNPSHLYQGTHQDNADDRVRRGRDGRSRRPSAGHQSMKGVPDGRR
ncbi:HNH endonuclease [Stenotrophomonas geniculata]|uniref:HNH endonuclease n=1 Tax=Stenotrophomonas geniculata TaxID=86188 RepID=UPI003CE48D29